jgi:magnesium-protoporphyrin IX monomethyl ester (oxidative) cyclase
MVGLLKTWRHEELRPGVKVQAKETLLTPRFYTTDFDEMARMDLSNGTNYGQSHRKFRVDYNRHHFVRDAEFERSREHIDGETRQVFIGFFGTCLYGGDFPVLLYKELGRRLKE